MGKHVLTTPSPFNYFEGLVMVMDDPIEDIRDLEWKAVIDFSEKYKELTYTDEAFEKYRQECITRYTGMYGDPFDINERLLDRICSIPNPLFERI